MQESAGKRTAREFFYRECLPSWFSREQLRSGNYLLLLGGEPRELPFLDEFGVPRNRIWSVERDYRVYSAQLAQNLGVSLYYDDMSAYLEHLLHGNQGFLVLNLDVEGSYFTQLDPAMTSVLLFTWRNPETAVATYSSIGRDSEMLMEGVLSLAVISWFSREIALEFVSTLMRRYREAGFTEPLHMALRDLFYLRSIFEHTLRASARLGLISTREAAAVFDAEKLIWDRFVEQKRVPLRLGDMYRVIDNVSVSENIPLLWQSISALEHLVYNAERPWSQRCYFAKFRAETEPIDCAEWLTQSAKRFIERPLLYGNRGGELISIGTHGVMSELSPDTVVWRTKDLYAEFKPRTWVIQRDAPHLATITAFCEIGGLAGTKPPRQRMPHSKGISSIKDIEGGDDMSKKNGSRHYVRNGSLTEWGRERLRSFASRGFTVSEIQSIVPRAVPERVIRAHVAVAHRKK